MIETQRLLLRPWSDADRDAFIAIVCDPEVSAWLGGARSSAQADADFDRMRAFWSEHGYGQLAIVRRTDNVLAGRVGVRRQPPEWKHPMVGEVEIGWMLARNAWGHGYATEAAAAMLPWGFETLATPTIFSWTAATNRRSEAIMRRLGMTRAPDRDFVHPDLAEDDPLRQHVVYVLKRPSQP